jgi:hypothetical protein
MGPGGMMGSRWTMTTLALAAACSEPSGGGGGTIHVEYKDIPVSRDVDVLFVLEDSSELDLIENLRRNFPNFISVLSTVEGGLPNLHLGVVTTDLGTQGAEDAVPGPQIGSGGPGSCAGTGRNGELQTNGTALVTGTFISDIKTADGSREKNYEGSLASAFSAIASVGAAGCGFEQPLEAAKRALNNHPANAGFLRPQAYLSIVFVQGEDDCSFAHSTLLGDDIATLGPLQSFRCNRFGHVCSQGGMDSNAMNTPGDKSGCASNEASLYLTRVGDYVTFFKGLKEDPTNVMIGVIAGPPTPYKVELRSSPGGGEPLLAVAHACTYSDGAAHPGVRMQHLLDLFPDRGVFATSCQQDLTPAMIGMAQMIRSMIGNPCFERTPADVDPEMPGAQYDCTVSDVRNPGKASETEVVLPQCNDAALPASSTNKPCWSIQPNPEQCALAPHLGLVVERHEAPSSDTHVIAACVVEP